MPLGDKPGHPIIFWSFIVILAYGLFSVSLAVLNHADCDQVSGGKKAWTIFPPEWDCGANGRIQFTRDD